jgi:hypothetical protein
MSYPQKPCDWRYILLKKNWEIFILLLRLFWRSAVVFKNKVADVNLVRVNPRTKLLYPQLT